QRDRTGEHWASEPQDHGSHDMLTVLLARPTSFLPGAVDALVLPIEDSEPHVQGSANDKRKDLFDSRVDDAESDHPRSEVINQRAIGPGPGTIDGDAWVSRG